MRGWFLGLALAALLSALYSDGASAQGYGCRGSNMSCEDLRYYCGMGDETPYSIRRFCGGRWGESNHGLPEDRYSVQAYRRPYAGPRYQPVEPDDDEDEQAYMPPQRNGYRELRYLCSLGDQTPYSVRHSCRRFGFW